MTPLPEGMECDLNVYFHSDKEDISICLSINGMKHLPETALEPDVSLFIKQLPPITDDWRPMTREEITTYKAQEEED